MIWLTSCNFVIFDPFVFCFHIGKFSKIKNKKNQRRKSKKKSLVGIG
jgi:hypothetical protein